MTTSAVANRYMRRGAKQIQAHRTGAHTSKAEEGDSKQNIRGNQNVHDVQVTGRAVNDVTSSWRSPTLLPCVKLVSGSSRRAVYADFMI